MAVYQLIYVHVSFRLLRFLVAFYLSASCLTFIWLCILIFLGAAFVELYFVLSSLFASRAYYAFGFLALTAGVVALTTATVSILFTYFMLCAEEYRYEWLYNPFFQAQFCFSYSGGIGDRF